MPGDDAEMSDSSLSTHGFDAGAYDRQCGEDKTSLIYREIENGPAKTIVGIVDADGVCASDDYVASLSTADQAQFKARFERYTQVGFLRSPQEMRIIEELGVDIRIHEIKTRNGHRLFGVQEERRFVASHGTRKPKDKEVKKHAARARSAYEEAVAREKEQEEVGKEQ